MKKMLAYLGILVAVVLVVFAGYRLWLFDHSPTPLRLSEVPFTGSTECPKGLSMEVTSVYTGAVNFRVTNDTGREYWTVGKQAGLEYDDNGTWYTVLWKEGVNTTSEATARKLETRDETLNISAFYGRLPEGHYRVICGVYPDADSALDAYTDNGKPDFSLASEFYVE